MTKKLLTLLLSLLFIVLPANTAFCDEVIYTEDGFQYTINGNSITIVNYYGDDTVVTIPRTIGLYDVTEIAKGTFDDTNVQSVNIPDTVVSVLDSDNLKGVTITKYDIYNEPIIEEEPPVDPPIKVVDNIENNVDSNIEHEIIIEAPESNIEIEQLEDNNDFFINTNEETTQDIQPEIKEEIIRQDTKKINYLSIIAGILVVSIVIIGIVIVGKKRRNKSK